MQSSGQMVVASRLSDGRVVFLGAGGQWIEDLQLGTLAVGAVRPQDIPMLQGLVLVMVALVVAVQLATDIVYGLLNPKARPT